MMAEFNKWMIDPNDAVMLLIDHQSGLFQLVRDIDQPTLRAHVCALAKVARLAKIPTFTTASVPDGPNGPLIPEIHQYNPEAVYIRAPARSTRGITRSGSKPSRRPSGRRCSSQARSQVS